MKPLRVTLLSFLFIHPCFSENSRTPLAKNILEAFFRRLLNDTSAGYVLFGDRPIFLCTLLDESILIPGTENHKWAIGMWAALDILNSLVKESNNYALKIPKPILYDVSEQEFLLINKQATIYTIQQNLPLFRLRMGVRTTPECILSNILDPKRTIASLFKSEHTLLAILFGYGSENGMVYERGVTIIKSSQPRPRIPYQNKISPQNENEQIEEMQNSKIASSLGFSSLQQEVADISNSLAHPTNNLEGTLTKIPFSYLKNSKESVHLLCQYKNSQKNLDKILSSENFLEQILNRLAIQLPTIDKKSPKQISTELIARSIWEIYLSIYPEENIGVASFIEGMKMAESTDLLEDFQELSVLDALREQRMTSSTTRPRYEKTKNIFKEIKELENIGTIEPNKIYFRTQASSSSTKRISETTESIKAYILVQDCNGRVLHGSHSLLPPDHFKLSELIPGVSHGLKNMALNESREIWIHPDYIYGIGSEFAEGAPIKVTIQLLDIIEGTEPLKALFPCDFLPQMSTMPWKALIEKYYLYSGYRIWVHLRMAKQTTLAEIISQLQTFSNQPDLARPLDEEERISLRQFHWQLYENQMNRTEAESRLQNAISNFDLTIQSCLLQAS